MRNYLLVENVENLASYATHPVVHQWVYHFQDRERRAELAQLAVTVIGWAVPHSSTQEYWIMQRRLLPHAQMCSRWVLKGKIEGQQRNHDANSGDLSEPKEKAFILDAIHLLGTLYRNQGKLAEAEQMY